MRDSIGSHLPLIVVLSVVTLWGLMFHAFAAQMVVEQRELGSVMGVCSDGANAGMACVLDVDCPAGRCSGSGSDVGYDVIRFDKRVCFRHAPAQATTGETLGGATTVSVPLHRWSEMSSTLVWRPDGTVGTDPCVVAPGSCGDGWLDAGEECDDGNANNDDDCLESCTLAVCGDGFINRATEVCDWGDPVQAGVCSLSCHVVDICGDANGDGRMTVNDAQLILRRSVGFNAVCPLAACDMDGSGAVLATDSRMALVKTVGLNVGERCSLGTGWIVFWTEHADGQLGALQLDVEYTAAGGEFRGSGVQVICESLVAPTSSGPIPASFYNDEEAGVLRMALVSSEGFSGPLDIARCWFDLPERAAGVHLVVRTVDASYVNLRPALDVHVGYRLAT